MLVWQAIENDLTLVSRDWVVEAYQREGFSGSVAPTACAPSCLKANVSSDGEAKCSIETYW